MEATSTSKADWVRDALDRYEAPLLRYAASICGEAERARDVVQDAFLKLCEAERAKVDGHLAPWLYTVVRNRALNVRKKEARMTPLLDSHALGLANGNPGPGEAAVRSEAHGLVASALEGLPENQQEACRLKFQDNLSYREISEVMGVSLGTVSNLLTRALDAIRQQLSATIDLAQEG